MVFSSLIFLFFYLPVTMLIYAAVPKKYIKARNIVLLLFSLVFYGWGEPRYVVLMVASVAISYFCGMMVARSKSMGSARGAKLFLILAIVCNLGMLGFFKYTDFFLSIVNLVPGVSIAPLRLTLPIGISFYTFQILSYVIDVYRGDAEVQKNPLQLGTYVALFPQLIAGPIVRYKDVDAQLSSREQSNALFASGVRTFLSGLGKKVLLANAAAEFFKRLNDVPADKKTVLGAWLGIAMFTFQIYFDFSGYSDMAIGLGKMFGFRFLENFNYPYISRSVTEFWRRWHISLSSWFREYVYFPLGGSRVDRKWKVFRNLLIVWLLTGFWHGADWNFILWGLFFFILLVIEKAFLLKLLEKVPKVVGHLYTMFFVMLGWVLFNFTNMREGLAFAGNMFGAGVHAFADGFSGAELLSALPLLAVMIVGATPLPKKLYSGLIEKGKGFRIAFAVLSVLLLGLCTASLIGSEFNPFIYFRF